MLIIKAIFNLKQYGDMRTMTSSNTDLRGPLIMIAVGAALMYTPSLLNSLLITVFGTSSVQAYSTTAGDSATQMAQTIIYIVQFVGFVAIVRGLFYLNKAGSGQGAGQQNFFGKGVIHVLGGVLCMNIRCRKGYIVFNLGMDITLKVE